MSNKTSAKFEKKLLLGGDLLVNRMGFGAMRIIGEGVWGPPEDKDEAIKVLKKVVELGIDFIDTADSYGPDLSEQLIAEALHPYPDALVIATKGGIIRWGPGQWKINAHPEHLRKRLEGSLKRLKADKIDLYQLHRVDPEIPFEMTLEFLQNVQEQGLVKHIGLSEVSVEQIRKAQEYVKVVSVQNKYSVDKRQWEQVLDYCRINDIIFIPWNPISAGNKDAMAKLLPVAQRYNVTPHQIALNWLLYHSPNILLIPGTSKVRHLEENYKSIDLILSEEDLKELDKIGQIKKS